MNIDWCHGWVEHVGIVILYTYNSTTLRQLRYNVRMCDRVKFISVSLAPTCENYTKHQEVYRKLIIVGILWNNIYVYVFYGMFVKFMFVCFDQMLYYFIMVITLFWVFSRSELNTTSPLFGFSVIKVHCFMSSWGQLFGYIAGSPSSVAILLYYDHYGLTGFSWLLTCVVFYRLEFYF